MIPRYSRRVMAQIWEPENRFRKWLQIELLACEAMVKLGEVPASAWENIRQKATFDPKRIEEIEKVVKHDVIAFLTSVSEKVGPEARYLHLGLTSSDILDTSLAMLLVEAAAVLEEDIKKLLDVLKKRAYEHKLTPMMGRTHGMHAEPITFGLVLALWYAEMERNLERLRRVKAGIAYGKISGAVGTYAHLNPAVEAYVCEKCGLKPAPISNQIVQRDRHADYFAALAIIASSVEKIALQIRHLQRTEVNEAEEPFSEGQKGSSAMPHKRNPIASENLMGLSRLMRSYSLAAMENIALWHERDISHSSVERIIAPDATILLDYMLDRLTQLLENLVVYPQNMLNNMQLTHGLVFSEGVMLKLVQKGLNREEAYNLVQKAAFQSRQEQKDFEKILLNDSQILKYLGKDEIKECFNLNHFYRHVETIFKRVFEHSEEPPNNTGEKAN